MGNISMGYACADLLLIILSPIIVTVGVLRLLLKLSA